MLKNSCIANIDTFAGNKPKIIKLNFYMRVYSFIIFIFLLFFDIAFAKHSEKKSVEELFDQCEKNIYTNPDSIDSLLIEFGNVQLNTRDSLKYYYYHFLYKKIYEKYTTASRTSILKGLQLAQRLEDIKYQIIFNGAMIDSYLHEQNKTAVYYKNLLQIEKEINQPKMLFMLYSKLMSYHLRIDQNIEKAKEYRKLASGILEKEEHLFTQFELREWYLNKAFTTENQEIAIQQMDTAIRYTLVNGDNYLKYEMYYWKIILLANGGITNPALIDYVNELLKNPEKDPRHKRIYYPYIIQAHVFRKEFVKAENRFKVFEKVYKDASYKVNNEVNVNMLGYFVYKQIKPSISLEYLEYYMNDVVERQWTAQDSIIVKYDREINKKEVEINLAKQELVSQRKSNQLTIVLIISGFVILLGTYLLYSRLKLKNQRLNLITKYYEKERSINEERSRFSENIAHEIKTPVTMVTGVLDMLEQAKTDEQRNELLELARVNANRLKRDIKGMMFLNNQTLIRKSHQEQIIILPFIRKTINEHLIALKSKSLHLSLSHNFTLASWVYLDEEKIQIVLNNLIGNAIKYSNEKGRIEVNCQVFDKQLSIKVTDYGKGIPKNEISKIFERFYQASNNKIGQGIGLSIVKRIIDELKGEISVSSIENEKTIFHFTIPVKYGKESDRPINELIFSPDMESRNSSLVTSQKDKLLIVDDNELLHQFYREVFFDYQCIFAFNGIDALNKLEDESVDCIISDIMMPELDGIGFKKALDKKEVRIPIIFVSASENKNVKIEALQIGVMDYIQKPFDLSEIRARVHNLINNYDSRKQEDVDEENGEIKVEIIEKDPTDIVAKMIIDIQKNIADPDYSVKQLGESVFYSESQIRRIVKRHTGLTPNKLIMEVRLLTAERMIKQNPYLKAYEIQEEIGIKSSAYFSRMFKDRFGINPSELMIQQIKG